MPVRTLPAQPPLPASVIIPVEAEDFTHQEQGKAEVVAGKPGAVGKSVRGFGNAAPDHALSWTFEVPQAEQYQLVIRYACKLPDASHVNAAILIDGAAPGKELTKISLPSPGGWYISEDNWKNLVVSDGNGKPIVFPLSQGRHELSLIKPSGALALDRLEFQGTGK